MDRPLVSVADTPSLTPVIRFQNREAEGAQNQRPRDERGWIVFYYEGNLHGLCLGCSERITSEAQAYTLLAFTSRHELIKICLRIGYKKGLSSARDIRLLFA